MATATSNRPGTHAKVRMVRMSASKARVVLNLIRGKQVDEAAEILQFTERLAAEPIAKCLASAVANAAHNEDLTADELFISACYADQGPTLKRFRPRARGRAGRIHKQTCHITIEVSRFTDEELDEARKRDELKSEGRQRRSSAKGSGSGGDRARRVAKSRAAADADADETQTDETPTGEAPTGETAEAVEEEAVTTEATETDTEAVEVTENTAADADTDDADGEEVVADATAGDEEE